MNEIGQCALALEKFDYFYFTNFELGHTTITQMADVPLPKYFE